MSRMQSHQYTQFVYPPGWDQPRQYTPREILANSPDVYNAESMSRAMFSRVMDPRRNIEDECGYPRYGDRIDVDLFRQLYDRDPISNRVVQCLSKESWQVTPKVYEEEGDEPTEFENAWDELEIGLAGGGTWFVGEEGSSIWSYLLRADILSGIGSFGVLLLGLDDGQPLHTPAAGALVTNSTTPYDSPITPQEEHALLHPATRKVWTGRTNKETKRRIVKNVTAPTLNAYERSVLGGWREERKRITVNAGGPQLERQSGTKPESKSKPSSMGFTSDGKSTADITGTDAQYSWQLQPPQSQGGNYPANPNGTDSQYYGVQFGPSEQPSDKPEGKRRKLLFLRPFDESMVQIVRYEWNLLNPRFGMPVMYRITLNDPRETHSGIGLPMATVFVHWSRVIHITDGNGVAGSSEVFSAPRLRPVLDRIYDLRKFYGAAGEAYWKGAFHIMQFSTHPQLGGDVDVNVSSLKDQIEQVDNGLQRWLLGRGGAWSAVAPTATDPTPFVTMAMEALCIQMGIPIRVFKGSERGELASSQDDSAWNDRLRHRQAMYLTPRVCVPFIDRLIQLGVLPEPKVKPASQGGKPSGKNVDTTGGMKDIPPPSGSRVPPPKENRFWPYAPRTYGRVENRYRHRVIVRNAFDKIEEKDFKDVNSEDEVLTQKTKIEKVVKADAPAGYHIEWPDLDSLSDKDKAAIFLQRTQAWAAYVSGGLENAIPVETFASKFDQMTEEEASAMVADTATAHEEDQTMTTPPMVGGRPKEALPGTQDHADKKVEQEQAKAQLDLKSQQMNQGPPPIKPNGKPSPVGGEK